jgi:hypothetical protein
LLRGGLLGVEKAERAFFFAAAHAANELNLLHKLAIWSIRVHGDIAIKRAQGCQALMLLRLLAGKLNEAYKLVDSGYFGSQLSRDYDALLEPKSREAIKSIRRYFRQDGNLIRRIRNSVAFHYSAPEIGAPIDRVNSPDEFDFYLAPNLPNTLYYFSEVLVAWTMLGEMTTEALERFMDETRRVARWFLEFLDGFIAAFSSRHRDSIQDTESSDELDLAGLPDFDTIGIPWFTTVRRPRRRLSLPRPLRRFLPRQLAEGRTGQRGPDHLTPRLRSSRGAPCGFHESRPAAPMAPRVSFAPTWRALAPPPPVHPRSPPRGDFRCQNVVFEHPLNSPPIPHRASAGRQGR